MEKLNHSKYILDPLSNTFNCFNSSIVNESYMQRKEEEEEQSFELL